MLAETAINGVPAYRAPMTTGGVYDATYWCDWTDGDDGYATIPQEKLMPWLVRCFQRRFSSVTPAFIGGNPSTAAITSLLRLGGQRPEEQNRRVRCNDAGVSPVPEVRGAAGLYVDDGSAGSRVASPLDRQSHLAQHGAV